MTESTMTEVIVRYIANRASRRHFFPTMQLRTLDCERCSDCGEEVLADHTTLQKARTACQRQGIELHVVCDRCGGRHLCECDDVLYFPRPTRDIDSG